MLLYYTISGYDVHSIIRELGKKFDTSKIGVIAENKEKYISFNVDIVVDRYEDELGKIKENST